MASAVIDNAAASGDFKALRVPPGTKFIVNGISLSVAGATALTFKSGASALSGAMSLITGVPLVMPHNRDGWYVGAALGDDLVINSSNAVQVSGSVDYALLGEAHVTSTDIFLLQTGDAVLTQGGDFFLEQTGD